MAIAWQQGEHEKCDGALALPTDVSYLLFSHADDYIMV